MEEILNRDILRGDGFNIESLPIEDLLNSIKRAIVFKQAEMQEHGIGIKSVQLILKTVAITDTGAKISLQIPILGKVEFGSEISEKSLQTTTLTLKPPTNSEVETGVKLMDMEEALVQSISSIVEGVKVAGSEENNSNLLEMEAASAEFNFILSGDSKISLIIGTGFESELTNTLKIKFEKQKIFEKEFKLNG